MFCEGFELNSTNYEYSNSQFEPYIAKCIPILVCTSSEVDQQQQISTDITTSTREKAKTLQVIFIKYYFINGTYFFRFILINFLNI